MQKEHAILFTPIEIGGMKLKNRFVMAAMGGTPLYRADGTYNREGCEYLIERARGGVGMITTGCNFLAPIRSNLWMKKNIKSYSPLWLHEYYEAFQITRIMTEQIHAYGAKILMQLGSGYGRALKADRETIASLGVDADFFFISASDGLPNVFYPKEKHRALTTEEVYQYIDAYVACAKMAKDAGFDGIELHAVHEGYLLDQFAFESMNRRTDEFGGSLENRLRFATESIRRIKEECGQSFVVTVRYSVCSKMKGFNSGALPGEPYKEFGRSLEESPAVARLLEAAGADALNADNGSYDAWYWSHPPMYMPRGCNRREVAYIKQFVSIPVICGGRMDDPDMAAEGIERGQFDAVGLARPLLADPQYVNKLREGRREDIRPCIACHRGCLTEVNLGNHLSCVVNPAVFQEEKLRLVPAEKKKKVAVVGGGIGGMEAARLCAERGHDVTLYEKSARLGGAFIAASAMDFKEADRELLNWYSRKVREDGVKLVLNTEALPQALKAEGFEAVIVANGARARALPIAGFENALPAVAALLDASSVGETAIIIGGGLTGVEIAYQLAKNGKKPVILEAAPEIIAMPTLCVANHNMLIELLKYYKVPIYTGARISEIAEKFVRFTDAEGAERSIDADTVIAAVGYDPEPSLGEAFKAVFGETYVIGDAREVGSLFSVIRDAYAAAYKI